MTPVQSTLIAAVIALLPLTTAASQESGVGIDQVREWIAAHHPRVYDDTSLNTVLIVLDAKGKYVRGLAARLDSTEVAATDLRFARLEELIAAREGRVHVYTLLPSACSGRPIEPASRRPICILDGTRVESFDGLHSLAIRKLETLSGPAATARYGADAANGVVVATTSLALLERLERLGFTAANMGWLQSNRVRAGTVGPRRLDILLVYLKGLNG